MMNSDVATYNNGVSILITPWLDAFYSVKPDSTFPAQLVSFGTSGHRGSSLTASFNELHILAIAQAVADYRLQACNDPAVSAQVRLLMHKLQQVFSFSTPDVGAECYRIKSSQQ